MFKSCAQWNWRQARRRKLKLSLAVHKKGRVTDRKEVRKVNIMGNCFDKELKRSAINGG